MKANFGFRKSTPEHRLRLLASKAKKPLNIGDGLVLPTETRMTEIVRGKKVADKMQKFPLSNDTVSRRISAKSGDISEQFIQRIKVG